MKAAVLGSLLVAAIAAGCASPAERPADDTAPVAVAVAPVAFTNLASSFEAGGVVRAGAVALIASRVMAPITEVHVRPGDRVRRGATLVTLDARDSQANQGRADAASISAAEAVRAAEADVRAAESALALARLTHDRMATLHARRSATAQELDQAVAALKAADAQQASAQSRLAAAAAARDAAGASATGAAVSTTYAVLQAPFDGLITERHADPGTTATPGMPLLTVEDPATYRLEVRLDEARAALVQIGHTVQVRVDSTPGEGSEWLDARVVEIARVDPVSHAFLVKLDLPASASWRSGLFGRARFPGPARRALIAPASSLVNRGQLTFVYLVDGDRRARLRPISIGVSGDHGIEVLAGLREGDVVVVNPPPSLIDGARVAGEPR